MLEYGNDIDTHPYVANQTLTLLAEMGYQLFDLDNACRVDAVDYQKRTILCNVLATYPAG